MSNLAIFSLGFLYFGMKHLNEGTDELPTDGFDLITLKVILEGLKGLKRLNLGIFATFWQISQKLFDNYFVYIFLGMILINFQEIDLLFLSKGFDVLTFLK